MKSGSQSSGEWSDLEVSWFFPTLQTIIGPVATRAGYRTRQDLSRCTLTYYCDDARVIHFSYLPETAPRYEFQCSVGIQRENWVETVPLWYLAERNIVSPPLPTDFRDREGLEVVARRYEEALFSGNRSIAGTNRAGIERWCTEFRIYWESRWRDE